MKGNTKLLMKVIGLWETGTEKENFGLMMGFLPERFSKYGDDWIRNFKI